MDFQHRVLTKAKRHYLATCSCLFGQTSHMRVWRWNRKAKVLVRSDFTNDRFQVWRDRWQYSIHLRF